MNNHSFLSSTQSPSLDNDPHDQDTDLIPATSNAPTHSPNAEQLSAIESPIDQPVLVLAGPGTGKTLTIAHRYKYLVDNGVSADDILTVTFGKRSAQEMQDRIKLLLPEIDSMPTALNQICSIHAACYRILRVNELKYSVPKTWQVKKISQELIANIWTDVNNRPGWKEAIGFTDSAKTRCYPAGSDKEIDYYFDVLESYERDTEWSGDRAYHLDKLLTFRASFDSAMLSNNYIRFPDMLYLVEYKLITDADFRVKWQDKYKYIIIDEGQDTSQQAVRILDTLASPQNNVMMVGDVDQLLYRFNGSDPEYNLMSFSERYTDTKLVKLVVNYRSTQEIVAAQTRIIQFNYSDSGGPYGQEFVKELVPRDGVLAGDGLTPDHIMFEDQKHEAESIAIEVSRFIESQRIKSYDYTPKITGEIFILARTRAQLAYIEAAMLTRKIPFINAAGFSFFNLKHVRDIIAYLQVAINPKNRDAFKRIYNIPSIYFEDRTGEYVPHRWLGRAFLELVNGTYERTEEIHNYPNLEGEWWRFKDGAEDLVNLVSGLDVVITHADHDQNPAAAVQFIIDQCYSKYLKTNEGLSNSDSNNNTGAEDDWRTVIDVAKQFDTVLDFVVHAEALIASGESKRNKDWNGYVVGSTIHRVKGLERDVVFIIGANEGLLPHAFSLANPPQNGVLPSGGKGRVEDERCAMFVAVSRAREVVYTSSVKRMRGKELMPSRFVKEMMG